VRDYYYYYYYYCVFRDSVTVIYYGLRLNVSHSTLEPVLLINVKVEINNVITVIISRVPINFHVFAFIALLL
jgi:hypothetical protein